MEESICAVENLSIPPEYLTEFGPEKWTRRPDILELLRVSLPWRAIRNISSSGQILTDRSFPWESFRLAERWDGSILPTGWRAAPD